MRDARCLNHMDPETKTVHVLLEAWGQWAHDMEARGWPPITLLGRMMKYGAQGASHSGNPPISIPEQIARVDTAVARLGDIDKRALVMYYTHWEPIEISARNCHMRVRQFQNVLRRARWRVACRLEA